MKWPCEECIVRARCSQECPDYKKFTNFLANVLTPIMMLFSTLFCTILVIYLSLLNNYHTWTWIFMAGSWVIWIMLQDEDDPLVTFFSPAFLPGWIGMKLLARIYKRT